MESGGHDNSKAYPMGLSYVPQCYRVSPSSMPDINPEIADVKVIDLTGLNDPEKRPTVVKDIGNACRDTGFFHIINHGIAQKVLDKALGTAFEFFDLPTNEKAKYLSSDVNKPVRYGTSLKDGVDKIQFWRVFLKLYANPLNDWIQQWPDTPSHFREKMGNYVTQVKQVAVDLMDVITESLGIGQKYFENKMKDGMQVVTVNCYPQCPEPHLTLGLPSHTDYSCLTIILQSSCGLEIMNRSNATWRLVPELHGALQVHVGDHLEVLSNGLYKAVMHRVTVNKNKTRVSIASLHSMSMDEKMASAKALIDNEHPKNYKESSVRDFLNFLSKNDLSKGTSFIESLKINK